jgi:LPXTG-motif cell wall-anchored protein
MKKLLILFMPFFMVGCDADKQPTARFSAQQDSIVALFGQLQQRVAAKDAPAIKQLSDSLGKIGQRYQWDGRKETFRPYILLNDTVGYILWKNDSKGCLTYFHNIIQQEKRLQTDSLPRYFWNNLYRKNNEKFTYAYNDAIVANFERCYNQQQLKPLLSNKSYFNTLQFLGISYHILGEKSKALQYYLLALETAPQTNKPNSDIPSSYINLFRFWAEYGQFDSILTNAGKALGFEYAELKRKATLHAYYAEALYAKDSSTYRRQLDTAWAMLQRIPNSAVGSDERDKRTDVLKLYGNIAFKQKQYPTAIQFYQQAIDTCLKKNNGSYKDRSYAKLLLCLANVHDSLKNYDTALSYSQFALACVTPVDSADVAANPTLQDLYTENTILEALDAKAGLLLKKQTARNDTALLQNAVQCFELAFAVEQKLLANFTYDDSRAELQVQTNSKQRSARAIYACYQLYQFTGQPYWAEKAFQFSESSKALILLEAIKKNLNLERYKNNPLFKQVDSLQLQLAYAERQLLTGTNDTAAALLRKEKLANELDMAQKALYVSEPSYKNYRQQQDTALLANLRQQLLRSNRHLVEFFCHGADNYLFVVKQNGPLVFARLDSSLQQQVDTLMGYFYSNAPIEPQPYALAAHRLFQSCGLSDVLPAEELLLIPDGPLNRVPFDALVTGNSTSGFKKLPYLFQSATTSYGYSAASLLQQPHEALDTGEIAAFAPVFKNGERGLPPLYQSEAEVKGIGAKQLYLGPDATTDQLRRSFHQAGIIHIATHASADSGNNPRIEMYDSTFYMSELYATPLRQTHLVVLSACQTNQGNIDRSEGTLSLARGCYYAGAQHIVASLWKVDDASTAAIMQQFYANGSNGQYADGLRKARQKYLQQTPPDGNTAPYYWAALMHIGGFGKTTGQDKNNWYGMAVLGLVLVGGFLLLLWRKRAKQIK